jgi:hypothetical protein
MADYTLNWSSDSLKPSFVLPGETIDVSSTSLALTGFGTINWGERVQENLIHLLENFASTTAPNNPTIGQTWYNYNLPRLTVYTGSEWKQLEWRTKASNVAPLNPAVGDFWYDTTTDLLKVYTKNGNWAYFALAVGSPPGAGGAGGGGSDPGTGGYVILNPSFAPFTGPVNVSRTQCIDVAFSSSNELNTQVTNGSYFSFTTLATGNNLSPTIAAYVNYLNDSVGQIRIKNLTTERWNDAGTALISTNAVGLMNAKNAPGTIVTLYSDSNPNVVPNFTLIYEISVSYNAMSNKFTFFVRFKVSSNGAYSYGTVSTDAITINGVFQYLKPNGVGSSMPTASQVSFG